jgi:hypothetical protein
VKIQQLSDQAIRQGVLTQVTLELGGINRKLDSVIDQSADAKVTWAIVEQMQRQIQPHPISGVASLDAGAGRGQYRFRRPGDQQRPDLRSSSAA